MVSKRELRRRLDFSKDLAAKGWYHSFELPGGGRVDGYTSLPALRERWARFPVPASLSGRRVLDIGAWDGWFSFEAERRGAQVTAIDCVEIPHFRWIHRILGSSVDYRILDVLDAGQLGAFDYVFFLGVLYHLRHPLLALEIVCAATTEVAVVDSFVTDASCPDSSGDIPMIEFYETHELGGQLDNWFGPSLAALMALCRAAGFARVELLDRQERHAQLACFRRWEESPAEPAAPPPELEAAVNSRDYGVNFSGRRDEYLTCWFRSDRATVGREDLRLECGGFGAPALYVEPQGERRWLANFLLPPGLPAGWCETRLRLADSHFSGTLKIAVAVRAAPSELVISQVCDAFNWTFNRLLTRERPFLSFWIKGLPDTCDRVNTRASLGGWRLPIDWIGPPDEQGCRQINVRVPGEVPAGAHSLAVECAGQRAEWSSSIAMP